MSKPVPIEVELELIRGGRVTLDIAPPGAAKTAYFAFVPHAGNEQIWPIIRKVLSAARHPIVQIGAELRKQGLKVSDLTESAFSDFLRREGYGFGPLWDLDRVPLKLDEVGRTTFLFVRDPREIIARSCALGPPLPAAELLRSPVVDNVARHYRSFMEFCRARQHVKIVRYEDVAIGWFRLAADLAHTLELAVKEQTLFEIAKVTTQAEPDMPIFTFRERLEKPSQAKLEEKFGEEMAYFGYAPEEVLPAAFVDHRREFLHAVCPRRSSVDTPVKPRPIKTGSDPVPARALEKNKRATRGSVAPARGFTTRDPDLRIRLIPSVSIPGIVLGRQVMMDVDAGGCRPVADQNPLGEKTLAVYGCSFTFGTAVPASETFCSILQSMFPDWRVENYGVPSYSQTQNVIQLQRNTRWNVADYVIFCWIPSHLRRNVAEISWLETLMQDLPRTVPEFSQPRATLDRDGKLVIRSTRLPRWDLLGG